MFCEETNNKINNPKTQKPIEDCWPLIHLSADRDERSFSQFGVDVWSAYLIPQSLFAL